jgi:DNA-binding response OmpR family regulator
MVVDDEKDILDIIKMALEKYNYLVRSHTDPRDALEDITSSPSQYSILLTDIRMPYMTGMQLATEALKINAAIEIIFMTAFEMDEQTIMAYPHLKRDEVMQKPFKVKELCDSIRKRLPKSG